MKGKDHMGNSGLAKRRNFVFVLAAFCITVALVLCTRNETPERPRNIILMIGDGMGTSHIYAGKVSSPGGLNMERCPYTGFQKTSSSSSDITDSGASATAMATGKKTYNGAIGVDPDGNKIPNIMEIARDRGLSTGIIATSTITHATPAAFAAHNIKRGNYEEIALDISRSGTDFIFGGGWSHFIHRKDGQNLLDSMQTRGYFVNGSGAGRHGAFAGDGARKSLEYLASDVVSAKPVIILSDSMAMPSVLEGRSTILADAVNTALKRLAKDRDGFLLLVEGSQIDWEAHHNNMEGVVEEMLDFDRAVGQAIDFAENNQETLVIVTADHETGGLVVLRSGIIGGKEDHTERDHKSEIQGSTPRVALEGNFSTKGHTGVMVPVFAYGPGAEDFSGIYENTAIFYKMKILLGL